VPQVVDVGGDVTAVTQLPKMRRSLVVPANEDKGDVRHLKRLWKGGWGKLKKSERGKGMESKKGHISYDSIQSSQYD
jgi:hypothetical protein